MAILPILILLHKSLHCLLTWYNQQENKYTITLGALSYWEFVWEFRKEILACFASSHFPIWSNKPHISYSTVAAGLNDFSLNSFVLLVFQQTLLLVNAWWCIVVLPHINMVGYFLLLLIRYHTNCYQHLLVQMNLLVWGSHPSCCSTTYPIWLRGFIVVAFWYSAHLIGEQWNKDVK